MAMDTEYINYNIYIYIYYHFIRTKLGYVSENGGYTQKVSISEKICQDYRCAKAQSHLET